MSSSIRAVLLVLVGVVAATALQRGEAKEPRQVGGPKLKVAVVDIGELFRRYARKAESEAAINRARIALKRELDADNVELKRKRKALKERKDRRSKAWQADRDALRLARRAFELKSKRHQALLKERVEADTIRLLKEIETVIAEWGKARDYDLILKVDRAGTGDVFREQLFRAQISDVLYHRDALKATNQVLRTLNDPQTQRRFRAR